MQLYTDIKLYRNTLFLTNLQNSYLILDILKKDVNMRLNTLQILHLYENTAITVFNAHILSLVNDKWCLNQLILSEQQYLAS